jgi:hypothetical protein
MKRGQRNRLTVAVVALSLSMVACGEAVVRSGKPAGDVATGYDARWHDSFLFGTVEPGEREPLARICPAGWSEIRVSASLLAGLIQWGTLGVYTPANVTVVCAAPNGVYVGAPSEVPLAPLCH